jgi:DNA-binding transcriptional regulator YiaG
MSYSPDIELYDLIDFSMPVGNTGIVFVAGLTGFRESDGTAQFIPGAVAAAYRRAASTLAHMSLVNGQTFQFIRLAQNMSVAQAAAFCGVMESEITDWEDGTTPVPVTSWQVLADQAAQADQRAGITWTALPTVDLRPRTIRIFPDIPYDATVPTNNCPPNPCP